LTRKKPIFVKNREGTKEIEMLTESIPQLILQIYIFQKKNDIFNDISSPSIFYEFYKSAQIGSIITSTFSILSGIISIYGYKAFYYYEQKRVFINKIRHQEKGSFQKIGRFISLFFWYFSIVISRILLIGLILSNSILLIIPLLSLIFIKSMILDTSEEKYFEQKKFEVEFEKKKVKFKYLSDEEYGPDYFENFDYYKKNSGVKKILTFFNIIFGVYGNIFINIEYHLDHFYIPRQTKNYIIFYVLFNIENIIFAIILYFGFNNNCGVIFFYVFTFPISVLIQILYKIWVRIEKVSFYFI
jgi:hypothetical protein